LVHRTAIWFALYHLQSLPIISRPIAIVGGPSLERIDGRPKSVRRLAMASASVRGFDRDRGLADLPPRLLRHSARGSESDRGSLDAAAQ
jgi:hypothetical protein